MTYTQTRGDSAATLRRLTMLLVTELLGRQWLRLRHPYSSEIKGSRYPLRELRSQKRKPLRVFYVFSPDRDAVLLLGGDKSGNPRFYDEMTPRAEAIWEMYLRDCRGSFCFAYGNSRAFEPGKGQLAPRCIFDRGKNCQSDRSSLQGGCHGQE